MSDDQPDQKPPPEPSSPVPKKAGRVSDDERNDRDDDDDRPEAGFDLRLPFLRAWGGKAEMHMIWAFLKWPIVGAAAVWGALELMRKQ